MWLCPLHPHLSHLRTRHSSNLAPFPDPPTSSRAPSCGRRVRCPGSLPQRYSPCLEKTSFIIQRPKGNFPERHYTGIYRSGLSSNRKLHISQEKGSSPSPGQKISFTLLPGHQCFAGILHSSNLKTSAGGCLCIDTAQRASHAVRRQGL